MNSGIAKACWNIGNSSERKAMIEQSKLSYLHRQILNVLPEYITGGDSSNPELQHFLQVITEGQYKRALALTYSKKKEELKAFIIDLQRYAIRH